MIPGALREAVIQAKTESRTPLYVNATAGTTVLGSYDPFRAVSAIFKEFDLWLHIDGIDEAEALCFHRAATASLAVSSWPTH